VTTRKVTTYSPEETIQLGRTLAAEITTPTLVLLYGGLGAGKTTLVKGIVSGLGVATEDDVTSPTFVLVREFHNNNKRVYHVDLYRIETERPVALESLGLEDLLAEEAVVLVEWPERLHLPKAGPTWSTWRIYLEGASEWAERRLVRIES